MSYSVVWLPAAENELAALWMVSSNRAGVNRASVELDRVLAANGPSEGESRASGLRITFVPPLAVIFQVDESTKTVFVGRVWEYR